MRSKALFRWIYRFAATLGFLIVLITITPVLRWWTSALSSPWGPDSGDVLVVLGGDIYSPPETLGIGSYWRSYYGALMWRNGHFARMIVTGRDVAPLMADFLAGHGVPRELITIENEANSTRENAVYVAMLLGSKPGRVVLLTSDYHSARALWMFHKAGIDSTALPFPDANKRFNNWMERWSVFLMLANETMKTVWYHAAYR